MKSKTLHRGQFTFYASYYDAVSQLPKSRRLETLEAICRYGLYGELPEGLSGAAAGVFTAVKPILDSGRTKAANRMSRNAAQSDPSVLPIDLM